MAFYGNPNYIMNFGNINHNIIFNNQMYNNMNKTEEIEDVYPYIIEEKKNIIFIRYENSTKKVKIPKSLRKNELYSTAKLYKLNKYSDIILSYNSVNLNDDESLIDDIPEGSEIYIIEELKNIDSQYYKKYLEKHSTEKQINIIFEREDHSMKNLRFTLNTTIQEMIKIYLFEMNIPEENKNDYFFIFSAETINDSNSTLFEKQMCKGTPLVKVIEKNIVKCQCHANKGKILKATIKNNRNVICAFEIGTLNQIKDFYSHLKKSLNDFDKIKIIEIEGKIYEDYEANNTFSSIGIRKDFVCKIKYENEKISSGCLIL
jgi:hypothetical protein